MFNITSWSGNCIVEAGEALTNNVNTITATGLLNSMHTSLPNKVSILSGLSVMTIVMLSLSARMHNMARLNN